MGGEPRHNYAHLYFTKSSFFFAIDVYGKKKVRDTSEIFFFVLYIYIYIYIYTFYGGTREAFYK